jgi:murein L,D-transpeptidase YcbB/YkuD
MFKRPSPLPIFSFLLFGPAFALTGCDQLSRLTGADRHVRPSEISAESLQQHAGDLQAFYETLEWRPAWTPSTAGQLIRTMGDAWRHGIDPARFIAMVSAEDAANRELELTRAALAYANALAHGLTDPRKVFPIYDIEMNQVDLTAGLSEALESNQLTDWLSDLAPQDEEYRALSQAYLQFLEQASRHQPPVIPVGATMKPGDSDPRVPQLVARLRSDGYLRGEDAQKSGERYTEEISEAVKAFQEEQGIAADGVVGPDTLAVLNAGPENRARQLALNLEARRWLQREVAPRRIDVNLPGAFMVLYSEDREVERRRVVVGTPSNKTPHLAHPFSQLVVNPPWTVPQRIAEEEILPHGPDYMAARNMSVVDGWVVQSPGPNSALGLVKFDMQNKHSIYLHDTPSKELFDTSARYYSHGCVRVEGAIEFARRLAQSEGKGDEFDRKLASGITEVVELETPILVRLLYHTAFVDERGKVAFRPDMYGWDAALAAALGAPAPMARDVESLDVMSLGP